jgi:hypothetical protein
MERLCFTERRVQVRGVGRYGDYVGGWGLGRSWKGLGGMGAVVSRYLSGREELRGGVTGSQQVTCFQVM